MPAIDLFCAPDDQHRVVLLVDLLKEAGQSVVLRPAAVVVPSNPCIVACTVRALREPWICSLFETAPTLVALRLDDTPLPGPCARAIGMQNWPARSADGKVGALVEWLLRHGPPLEVAGAMPREAHARPSRHEPAASASGPPRRRRRREGPTDTWRNLTVLTFLAVGGALLWWAATERDPGAGAAQSASPDPLVEASAPDDVDELASTERLIEGSAEGPAIPATPAEEMPREPAAAVASADPPAVAPDHGAPTAATRAGHPANTALASSPATTSYSLTAPADVAADTPRVGSSLPVAGADEGPLEVIELAPEAVPRPAAEPLSPPAEVPPVSTGDALAHLCQARTLAAATAWAGVLDWKQRRRLPQEPCLATLLARPDFAGLEDVL